MKKTIIYFLILVIITAVQFSFLPGFSPLLPVLINLPLFFWVFIIYFEDKSQSFNLAIIAGLLVDIYAFSFFGFFIILFVLEFFIINFLINRILRNKNFVSLIIAQISALVGWHLIYFSFLAVSSSFSQIVIRDFTRYNYLYIVIFQIITHLVLTFLIYIIFPSIRRRLNVSLIN